ncbi:Gfo/Idh/MocA family protein [Exiguobacterium oxidotolerans]|uniref:Oxidoreductase domain-containing protein n=1 Tax=Exiguobacterium oxidotolerans TaxID=223958 RepID=A0A653I919_9BACL|nr:Gfo/Idh/MocA family oxidoreductase [Exiguobacterium oxidotolerans]VWX35398.1 Oxidoreductase domain-containing protein [Exiguobacterium oxidotolerans]
MEQVNWGIVGPGGIAAEFAAAIKEVNGRIFGVWGRNTDKTNRFAEQFGIEQVYADTETMFQDGRIDVVYIATPHSVHYSYIVDALNAGKHVLCEKAITMNSTQLQEVIQLAQAKDLILAEAMTIYHMPLYRKLHEVIDQGKIGKISMVNVTFGSSKEDDPTNRFFNPDLAGGAMLDIGTYALSFTRLFLSSQPTELHTTLKKYKTGVDEQSGIVMKNNQEELAVVSLAMRAKMPKRGIVAGEKGFITVDDFPRADKATITYTADGTVETIEAGDTGKALVYEVEAMNEMVMNGRENWTLPLSRQVMSLMDEARQQWDLSYAFE